MPSKSVNETFNEIFSEENESQDAQETSNQTNFNSGFNGVKLSPNEALLVEELSKTRGQMLANLIEVGEVQVCLGILGMGGDMGTSYVTQIIDANKQQSDELNAELNTGNIKNFLSYSSSVPQLTGCTSS